MAKGNENKVRHVTQREELPGILTKDIFVELASFENKPCISILMPTHRSGVEVNEQVDKSTFKNILQQVEKKLTEKKGDPAVAKNVLQPAYDLLNDNTFW